MVAGEVKNPQRNLPIALISGILVVSAIYMLANLAYFYVLSSSDVAAAERVAADMMTRILGAPGAAVVSIAAMISIFAALNGSILSGSRIPYALARDGLFFRKIAEVNPKYHTPAPAILLMSICSAMILLSGHYSALYRLVLFPSWILYGMATAAVIVLRHKQPNRPRPYRTLGYPFTPLLFVAAAAALLISTLVKYPRESLLGLSIILAGIPFYLYWNRRRI
jgi:APA family basic amino acid/polyamine antiporter